MSTIIFGKKKSKMGYASAILFNGEYYTPRGIAGQKDIKDLPFMSFVMASPNIDRNKFNVQVMTEHDCGYNTCFYQYEFTEVDQFDWELIDIKFYHY